MVKDRGTALLLVLFVLAFVFCNPLQSQNIKNYPLKMETFANDHFTGMGNRNEVLYRLKIDSESNQTKQIIEYQIRLTGNNPARDLKKVRVFATRSLGEFDGRNVQKNNLITEFIPQRNGEIYTIKGNQLQSGPNFLWITADIAETATEGNFVGAIFESISLSDGHKITIPNQTVGYRQILLAYKPLFSPGDHGSRNYRIPAIVTAADNSLVVLADKRKFNEIDLPEDIDVVSIRSTDGGKNWSQPVTIAKGLGRNQGFGDAAMVVTASGKIIAIFVGDPGLWGSTPQNPIRTYISQSEDNGISWSLPHDITPQLFGSECSDLERRNWRASFCAAGRGIQTKSGRIMFVAAVRENAEHVLNNYLYYSDDDGNTWNVSQKAFSGGDEAKVVELNNGDILMSIRNKHKGERIYTVSKDDGITWSAHQSWSDLIEPACNGEIIRYTSVLDGYNKNRLLHTIANDRSERRNVSVFLSYDEGKTWPVKKSICPTASAYSSATILPDGTIGVFFEKEIENTSLYFVNFSLDWLTNNTDRYSSTKKRK